MKGRQASRAAVAGWLVQWDHQPAMGLESLGGFARVPHGCVCQVEVAEIGGESVMRNHSRESEEALSF